MKLIIKREKRRDEYKNETIDPDIVIIIYNKCFDSIDQF